MSDDAERTRVDVHRARMRLVDAAIRTAHELAEAGDLRGPIVVLEGMHRLATIRVADGRPTAILVRID